MSNKLKVLDLFSGIGGFSLGLERTGGFETVAFCEIDPFCQKVLRKHWPDVPIYNDVRNLQHDGPVDVITGGFPCQDISVSGRGAGLDGERSGLYKFMFSLIGKIRPKFIIMENSPNLIFGNDGEWFGTLLGELASLGYDAEWHCLPASYVGAPHGRDRVWIIADTVRQPVQPKKNRYLDWSVFHQRKRQKIADPFRGHTEWAPYNGALIMDDGVSRNVDAYTALGNSVVPQIPEIIGHAILAAESSDV